MLRSHAWLLCHLGIPKSRRFFKISLLVKGELYVPKQPLATCTIAPGQPSCFLVTNNDSQVMIININPYDTGFDENSHVMRFAAIAREVTTSTATTGGAPKVTSFLPPSHAASRAPSRLKHTRAGVPALDTSVRQPVARKVVLSLGSSSGPEFRRGGEGARPSVNTVVDVIEGDLLVLALLVFVPLI